MSTVTTTSATPTGTYQIVAVFAETLPGAASGLILLPFLLVLLWFLRRRPALRNLWATLALAAALATVAIGCGGSGAGSSTGSTGSTHQVTSSGTVTLTVK